MKKQVPVYLTSSDAAKVLGMSPATIRSRERMGTLKCDAVTYGGIRLFLLATIESQPKAQIKSSVRSRIPMK